MINAIDVIKAAEEEVREERLEAAKKRIKIHMKAVEDAKVILHNAERELEDELTAIESGN
jgi:hypothetical protein